MQQVKNRRDPQPLNLPHRLIRKRPVISPRRNVDQMIGQPIAQHRNAKLFHQCQVLAPALIVPALRQKIAPKPPPFLINDARIGALDPCGKRKIPRPPPPAIPGRPKPLRRRTRLRPPKRAIDPMSLEHIQKTAGHRS
jgi:hypothetical protein